MFANRNDIELGALLRRERELVLRLENTRARLRELRAKKTPPKRGEGGDVVGSAHVGQNLV